MRCKLFGLMLCLVPLGLVAQPSPVATTSYTRTWLRSTNAADGRARLDLADTNVGVVLPVVGTNYPILTTVRSNATEFVIEVPGAAEKTNAAIIESAAITGLTGDGVRLAIRKVAGQTNNILEIQDTNNARLSGFGPSGQVVLLGSGASGMWELYADDETLVFSNSVDGTSVRIPKTAVLATNNLPGQLMHWSILPTNAVTAAAQTNLNLKYLWNGVTGVVLGTGTSYGAAGAGYIDDTNAFSSGVYNEIVGGGAGITADDATNAATTVVASTLNTNGNTANYLDGTGNWSTPAGSGGTFTNIAASGGMTTNNSGPFAGGQYITHTNWGLGTVHGAGFVFYGSSNLFTGEVLLFSNLYSTATGYFTKVVGDGSLLTDLSASSLASGTLHPSRLGTTNGAGLRYLRENMTWDTPAGGSMDYQWVTGTVHQTLAADAGSFTTLYVPSLDAGTFTVATLVATNVSGNGSNLTNLSASALTGTVPDAGLSTNVPIMVQGMTLNLTNYNFNAPTNWMTLNGRAITNFVAWNRAGSKYFSNDVNGWIIDGAVSVGGQISSANTILGASFSGYGGAPGVTLSAGQRLRFGGATDANPGLFTNGNGGLIVGGAGGGMTNDLTVGGPLKVGGYANPTNGVIYPQTAYVSPTNMTVNMQVPHYEVTLTNNWSILGVSNLVAGMSMKTTIWFTNGTTTNLTLAWLPTMGCVSTDGARTWYVTNGCAGALTIAIGARTNLSYTPEW